MLHCSTSTTPSILSHHSHPTPPPQITLHRRRPLLLLTTTTTTLSLTTTLPCNATTPPQPDTTITDKVYLDLSICPNFLRPDRTLSDTITSLCSSDSLLLGRLVLGLYGNHLPLTVSHFKTMCMHPSSSYKNTLVHKIFPGQFFLAGHQGQIGSKVKGGEVTPPLRFLSRNTETIESKAFMLKHSKGGLLSLCLSENDDDDDVKLDPDYRNVEFLITTGPGPCPQLDNKNIVFGTVLQGMDVVTAVASIPTYRPAERVRMLNEFAQFLGDERAQNARSMWNKPLKTVYISDCGEIKGINPSLTPSLP